MFKWIYKIVFILISLSFFISATEMEIGEGHNTFFDEYDTYVQSKEVDFPTQHTVLIDQFSLHDGCSFEHALPVETFQDFDLLDKAVHLAPQKIYLRKSVLRI